MNHPALLYSRGAVSGRGDERILKAFPLSVSQSVFERLPFHRCSKYRPPNPQTVRRQCGPHLIGRKALVSSDRNGLSKISKCVECLDIDSPEIPVQCPLAAIGALDVAQISSLQHMHNLVIQNLGEGLG